MSFFTKVWSFLKKVPGWVWAAIVIVLSIAIPSLGWWRERKKHNETKKDRDIQKDKADRAVEIAKTEANARAEAEKAAKTWLDKLAEIKAKRDEVDKKTDAVEDRIDANAGDVDKAADDINKELGLE